MRNYKNEIHEPIEMITSRIKKYQTIDSRPTHLEDNTLDTIQGTLLECRTLLLQDKITSDATAYALLEAMRELSGAFENFENEENVRNPKYGTFYENLRKAKKN